MQQLESNKAVVIAFYKLMFDACRLREALDLYAGADYIQHNLGVATGDAAFVDHFEKRRVSNSAGVSM